MSASLEEVIIKYNNELKEQNKELIIEQARLTEKVGEYQNKFSCYTKEQACLLFKIQKVKQCLNNMNIKKSGKNNFQHYSYYELEDINKPIADALITEGLASLFTFKDGKAYLQIIDSTTGAWIQWSTEVQTSERWKKSLEDTSKKGDVGDIMKAKQALQTYARRTLYLQALEIAEPNTIEQEPEQQKPQKKKPQKTVPQKKVEQPKVSSERVNEILDQTYERVTLEAGKEFTLDNALWTINKLCENEAELEAVKSALNTYTADNKSE